MKRILVVGCPGGGKSTFAKKLHQRTNLPLYHLDLIWHKADKTTITREEFDQRLQGILQTDAWIIDGNYSRTLEMRLQQCDKVFLLDFPTEVCLQGARSRVGRPHNDLPFVEETFDPEFEQWIRDFSAKELPKVYALLETYSQVSTTIFKSREELNRFLENEL